MENVTSYKSSVSSFNNLRYVGSSELYKCVRIYKNKKDQSIVYKGELNKRNGAKVSKTSKIELEAAKWVDIEKIKDGQEPVNILKRK